MKAITARAGSWSAALLALLVGASAIAAAASPFDASPGDHALIVVDVTVQQKVLLASSESPLIAGALTVRTPGARDAREIPAQAIGGVLPFAVEPGRYRPRWVTARVRRMQPGTGSIDHRIAMPTDSLAVDRAVRPGDVVYVGRIDALLVPRPFKENDYRFTLLQDRGRERAVWEKLLATGKTGAWEGPIRARLDALSAASDTTGGATRPDSTR